MQPGVLEEVVGELHRVEELVGHGDLEVLLGRVGREAPVVVVDDAERRDVVATRAGLLGVGVDGAVAVEAGLEVVDVDVGLLVAALAAVLLGAAVAGLLVGLADLGHRRLDELGPLGASSRRTASGCTRSWRSSRPCWSPGAPTSGRRAPGRRARASRAAGAGRAARAWRRRPAGERVLRSSEGLAGEHRTARGVRRRSCGHRGRRPGPWALRASRRGGRRRRPGGQGPREGGLGHGSPSL